jgi:hypothetical protein
MRVSRLVRAKKDRRSGAGRVRAYAIEIDESRWQSERQCEASGAQSREGRRVLNNGKVAEGDGHGRMREGECYTLVRYAFAILRVEYAVTERYAHLLLLLCIGAPQLACAVSGYIRVQRDCRCIDCTNSMYTETVIDESAPACIICSLTRECEVRTRCRIEYIPFLFRFRTSFTVSHNILSFYY